MFVFGLFAICWLVSMLSFGFVCGYILVMDAVDFFRVRAGCWQGSFSRCWSCVRCFFDVPVPMHVGLRVGGGLFLHMERLLQYFVIFFRCVVCCGELEVSRLEVAVEGGDGALFFVWVVISFWGHLLCSVFMLSLLLSLCLFCEVFLVCWLCGGFAGRE